MKKYFIFFLFCIACDNSSIKWYPGNLENALLENSNKIIMIDFYTDW